MGPQKGPTETAVVPEGPVKKVLCEFFGEGKGPRTNPDSQVLDPHGVSVVIIITVIIMYLKVTLMPTTAILVC